MIERAHRYFCLRQKNSKILKPVLVTSIYLSFTIILQMAVPLSQLVQIVDRKSIAHQDF